MSAKFKGLRMHRRNCELLFLIFSLIIACLLLTQYVLKSLATVQLQRVMDQRLVRQQQLKTLLKCHDRPLELERLQYGQYWLLKNYIRGERSIRMGCSESITYTANGDYLFFENLGTVVKRWMGPISFALFAPGYDFEDTMSSILYARQCLPESQLIREYVTFHIYFPNNHMPYKPVPLTEADALQWPYDCEQQPAPYEMPRGDTYKAKTNLTYPINVGRNIARKAANTHFVFACDIELYPSLGFIDQFLEMAHRNFSLVDRRVGKPRVFPLPVFELEANATLPDDKEQLVEMLDAHMAVAFHAHLCMNCHVVPEQKSWVRANVSDAGLEVFTVGKRYGKFVYWEPFYISDNSEPEFDERVTWEGQSNKRIQNYAMCLLDYEYHVLHPAFLVHAPGIKRFNPKSDRLRYVQPMNKLITNTIVPEYKVLYGTNKKCKV